jgi:pimeloyl-ACP methyl ester carboxylesterase
MLATPARYYHPRLLALSVPYIAGGRTGRERGLLAARAAGAPVWLAVGGERAPSAGVRASAIPRSHLIVWLGALMSQSTERGLLAAQAADRLRRPPDLLGYAFQLYAVSGWSSLPWLHRLPQPTLVVAGEQDPSVPLCNARLLAARIPDARLHVVKGGGHLFLLDEPENVTPTILDFLAAG